jgi:EAL domain-containing protein (putative c-di-GMP-specific phosphodiesterase class I)/CheY-like chemotaxis protein
MMRPVLVIEDDAGARRLLADVLEDDGHRVLAVGSARDARRALGRTKFGAILIDVGLPDLSGIDLVREIRGRWATLPIIVVTGADEVADRVAGLDAGANDYIVKPFDPKELQARLRAQLRDQTAWTDQIEQAMFERSAAVHALARVQGSANVATTAAAVCDAAMGLSAVDGAAIVWFSSEGEASAIGARGSLGDSSLRSFTTPAAALGLRARAATTAWFEPLGWDGGVVACAPLIDGNRPIGVLMLASRRANRSGRSHAHHELAAAVDVAAVASILLVSVRDTRGDAGDAVPPIIDLRDPMLNVVFQPIVSVETGLVAGWEALSRFDDGAPPRDRFEAAHRAGIGADLEVLAVRVALDSARGLPGIGFVAVNLSPSVIVERAAELGLLIEREDRPIVIELTEHDAVEDYAELRRALVELRPATISVDDAGTGFASLRHVVLLRPDYVKLDRSWIAGIDGDNAKQAMVAGLVHYARTTGTILVAEGIETKPELASVRAIGVDLGQGYFLGAPEPAADLLATYHDRVPQSPT